MMGNIAGQGEADAGQHRGAAGLPQVRDAAQAGDGGGQCQAYEVIRHYCFTATKPGYLYWKTFLDFTSSCKAGI